MKIRLEEVKLSLFGDDIILYIKKIRATKHIRARQN